MPEHFVCRFRAVFGYQRTLDHEYRSTKSISCQVWIDTLHQQLGCPLIDTQSTSWLTVGQESNNFGSAHKSQSTLSWLLTYCWSSFGVWTNYWLGCQSSIIQGYWSKLECGRLLYTWSVLATCKLLIRGNKKIVVTKIENSKETIINFKGTRMVVDGENPWTEDTSKISNFKVLFLFIETTLTTRTGRL